VYKVRSQRSRLRRCLLVPYIPHSCGHVVWDDLPCCCLSCGCDFHYKRTQNTLTGLAFADFCTHAHAPHLRAGLHEKSAVGEFFFDWLDSSRYFWLFHGLRGGMQSDNAGLPMPELLSRVPLQHQVHMHMERENRERQEHVHPWYVSESELLLRQAASTLGEQDTNNRCQHRDERVRQRLDCRLQQEADDWYNLHCFAFRAGASLASEASGSGSRFDRTQIQRALGAGTASELDLSNGIFASTRKRFSWASGHMREDCSLEWSNKEANISFLFNNTVHRQIQIIVYSASGLPSLSQVGVDAYCTCEVPGKVQTRFSTKIVVADQNPVWNHETMYLEYELGDALEFAVWIRRPSFRDERIGMTTLLPSDFYPEGTEGEFSLYGDSPPCFSGRVRSAGKYIKIKLKIIVLRTFFQRCGDEHQWFCAQCKINILDEARFCHLCGRSRQNKAEYYRIVKAVIKLQKRIRTWSIDRKNLEDRRQAATKIQACQRAKLSRREVRKQAARKANAATRIQAGWRSQQTLRGARKQKAREADATKIQAVWRGRKARHETILLVQGQKARCETNLLVKEAAEGAAATKIQSWRRGQIARKQTCSLREKSTSVATKACDQRSQAPHQCSQCYDVTDALFLDCSNGMYSCEMCWIWGCQRAMSASASPSLVPVEVSSVWSEDQLTESWVACKPFGQYENVDGPPFFDFTESQQTEEGEGEWQNISIRVRRGVVGRHARESHVRCRLDSPTPGEVLLGKYSCQRRLGQGHFTNAFLAVETTTGRQVCLKRHHNLTVEGLSDLLVISRRLEDVDRSETFFPLIIDAFFDLVGFTVESLVKGQDCQTIARRDPNFFTNLENIRGLARGALYGLTLLERAGVVHNDVKPDNLMLIDPMSTSCRSSDKALGAKSFVRIVDWGSARLEQSLALGENWNMAEGGAGHVGKWAPEMVLGLAVTHRGDVWGLGVSLCELLCGRAAWRDENDSVEMVFSQWLGLCGLQDGIPSSMLRKSHVDFRQLYTPAPRHLPIRWSSANSHVAEVLQPTKVGLDQVLGKKLWNAAVDCGFAQVLKALLVVDPRERPSAQMLIERFFAPIRITLVRAKGLHSRDDSTKSDRYCACQVLGKPETMFSTEALQDNHNSTWNHAHEMLAYVSGDSLEFKVFDKDSPSEELLGAATLAPGKFETEGFFGELPLAVPGSRYKGTSTLLVKIELLNMQMQQYQHEVRLQLARSKATSTSHRACQRMSKAASPQNPTLTTAVSSPSRTGSMSPHHGASTTRKEPFSPVSSPSRMSAKKSSVRQKGAFAGLSG